MDENIWNVWKENAKLNLKLYNLKNVLICINYPISPFCLLMQFRAIDDILIVFCKKTLTFTIISGS